MEYHPKHPQPFSFSEALKFDPATITEGSASQFITYLKLTTQIARLQNSLRHLKRTQDELSAHSEHDDDHDAELTLALKENEAVIASQEERVDMLNLALVEKGVITSSSHYGPAQNSASVAPQPQPPALPSEATMDEFHDDDEGGVVL
ncbi:hypothetical protein BGW80DRAFT_1456085 [Lactifluus volemus]|nr:hypothetical protein BGW80DRAFT_1456085 [Lactifluus volemus]